MKLPKWTYDLVENVLVESIRFPTVLGESYGDIVKFYSDVLKDYGVHVTVHKVPEEYVTKHLSKEANPDKPRFILHAKVGSGERVLQFNGHYDVVSPGSGWTSCEPFNPVKRDGRVCGRGSSDMKAGIAVFTSLLAYLAGREDLDVTVEAVYVPDEEIGGLTGTGYLVNELNSRPTWVIIAEPSGLNDVWIGHKGLVWGYVKTEGVQSHGSTPWLGVNAFEKLVIVAQKFIEKYKRMLKERRSSYNYQLPEGSQPTVTVGGRLISPGSINVVPGLSGFSIDRRLIIEEKTDSVVEEIKRLLEEIKLEVGVEAFFEVVEKMEPALTNPESRLVNTVIEVTYRNLGFKPRKTICVGGLDMRYYTYVGVDAVTYGPGEPDQPHRANEYVDLKNVYSFLELYHDVVYELNGYA